MPAERLQQNNLEDKGRKKSLLISEITVFFSEAKDEGKALMA